MTFVMKLNQMGAILIIIDSILELFNIMGKNTPWHIGLICLLLGVFIFILTPQLEYDYKVQWAAAALAAQWFSNAFFHGVLKYQWATGLGFFGIVIVIISGVLVILGAAIGAIVVQNIGLFKPYQYYVFGLEVVAIECSFSFFFKLGSNARLVELLPELFCFGCLGFMTLGTMLVWKKRKITGALLIWIVNNVNSAFTGIDGFNAGGIILGLISFIMAMFAVLNHWADPYKRKTRIPRRSLSMAIKDAYYGIFLLLLFGIKSKKIKKKGLETKKSKNRIYHEG